VSPYELTVRDLGNGTLLFAISGELDLTNASELESQLENEAPDASRLVLDLNGVEFVDSAVLHVLFRLARRQGADGLVLVVAADAPIRRALTLVGLERAAALETSLEALDLPAG